VCASVGKLSCRQIRKETRSITSPKAPRLSIIVPKNDRLSQTCSGCKMSAFYFCKTLFEILFVSTNIYIINCEIRSKMPVGVSIVI
jgi:hypothetical protein